MLTKIIFFTPIFILMCEVNPSVSAYLTHLNHVVFNLSEKIKAQKAHIGT